MLHIYILNSVCFKAIFCYNVRILNKLSSSLDATWENKRLIYGLIDWLIDWLKLNHSIKPFVNASVSSIEKIKLVLCSKVEIDGGILHNTRNHATITKESVWDLRPTCWYVADTGHHLSAPWCLCETWCRLVGIL